jgi:diketogulonate reductase-like aldo/keto reductase
MNFTLSSNHFLKTLAGIQMPRIIYGTAWKKEKTTILVVEAVLAGFKAIDTACQPKHYREDLVGEALAILNNEYNIKRESLFIQTKFTSLDGQDPKNIPYDKNSKLTDQVYQSLEKSFTNLQTNYLDSLVIHSPMKSYDDTMTVWKIFEEFVSEGKVKQIGISNIYSIKLLEKIWDNAKVKPSVIQNRFYADTSYDTEIRKFCRLNGIIYQSFWTLTANPKIIKSKEVKALAKNRNCNEEQIFFKFVMQIGIAPLTGTTNKQHMKEDLEVLDMNDLSSEDIKILSSMIGE